MTGPFVVADDVTGETLALMASVFCVTAARLAASTAAKDLGDARPAGSLVCSFVVVSGFVALASATSKEIKIEDTRYSAGTLSQMRLGMARVVKGSYRFICHPRVYPRME